MKHNLFLVTFLLSITCVFSQGINYKALIKDGGGNVVASQSIIVQFKILQGGGLTNVYQETHTPNTDANGIIIINIGEGSVNSGVFTTIDWGSDDHFLNVQINTGSGLTDMGTTQFMAVPYALSAANSATKIDDLSDGKSDADGSSLFLGINAGLNDDGTNNQNVSVGYNTLYYNTTGGGNTAIGYYSLFNNTISSYNTALGYRALRGNTTGNRNTAVGSYAMDDNTIGNDNTAIGRAALSFNTTGSFNTALGNEALRDNSNGSDNTAIGYQALFSNTTGNNNTANGNLALYSNTIGFANTANGHGALYSNNTGSNNTANGPQSLGQNTTGSYNTANGYFSLRENTTGYGNTATGYYALYFNTTGIRNTAYGFEALRANTTGNYNTGFGYKTLYNQTTGHWNTAIGRNALLNLTAGTNNIGIGYNAQPSSTTVSNEVTIGNSSNNVYRMYASSWTNASDIKLKHAIKNIPVGLDFVLKLRPVEFVYNNANNEQKTFGFIAQEVKEAVKQSNLEEDILVSPLNKKYLGLRTTELISVLTKAIQEQQGIIDNQDNKINTLTIEISALKSLDRRVKQLEALLNTTQQ